MLTTQPCFDVVQQDHIQMLVRAASELGTTDPYTGKRHFLRPTASLPLIVAMEASRPQRTTNAKMHNVSEGGISFCVRKRPRIGNKVLVWTQDAKGCGEGIEATVRHCTRGLLGYLVGAEFCVQPASRACEAA